MGLCPDSGEAGQAARIATMVVGSFPRAVLSLRDLSGLRASCESQN